MIDEKTLHAAMGTSTSPFPPILAEVSEKTGVSVSDILGNSRRRYYVRARQLVMWAASQKGLSLTEIAHWIGRDHTTVLHGIRSAQSRIDQGPNSHLDRDG